MFLLNSTNNRQFGIVSDSYLSNYNLGDFVRVYETLVGNIPSGSLVFFLADNSAESVAVLVGLLNHNAVTLMLSHELDGTLLNKLNKQYPPNFIIKLKQHSEEINLNLVYTFERFSIYKNSKSKNINYNLHPKLKFLLPTSGSTGSPKLVRHSLENITASSRMVSKSLGIKEEDVALGILPLYYTMGMSVVLSHLFAGAKLHMSHLSLTDRNLWQQVKSADVSNFTGVPYSFEILDKLRFERIIPDQLKVLSQGGGKLRTALFEKIAQYCVKNNKLFIATYGQTESSARMTYLPPGRALDKVGSIGIPISECRIELHSENGSLVNLGETGEIVFFGPNVTMGYAQQIEDLALGDVNMNVLKTGDLAYVDEEGFYYIKGRKSRFLKVYGSRISLDEVEQIILNRFQMACAVGGVDDNLIIQLENSIDDSSKVVKHISEIIGIHHSAIKLERVDELKRTSSGKIVFNR